MRGLCENACIKVRVTLFTATLHMHVGEFTNISVKRGYSGCQTLYTATKFCWYYNIAKELICKYHNVIGRLCSWQFCYPEGKNQGKNDRWGGEIMTTFHLLLKHSNCTFWCILDWNDLQDHLDHLLSHSILTRELIQLQFKMTRDTIIVRKHYKSSHLAVWITTSKIELTK